jgi:hypothetical protein
MKRKNNKKYKNQKQETEGSILQFLKPKNSLLIAKENLNENEDLKNKTEEEEEENSETFSSNTTSKKNIKITIPIKRRQNIFQENNEDQNEQKLQNKQIPKNQLNLHKIKKETNENSKKKIILNENFIEEFLKNFSFFNEEIEKNLKFFNEKNNNKIFSKKNFSNCNDNLNLFVIKFFLHIEEIFIFVPNFLSNSKMEDLKEIENKKHLFKLFEGFNNDNNFLNYQPISSKEVKKNYIHYLFFFRLYMMKFPMNF